MRPISPEMIYNKSIQGFFNLKLGGGGGGGGGGGSFHRGYEMLDI